MKSAIIVLLMLIFAVAVISHLVAGLLNDAMNSSNEGEGTVRDIDSFYYDHHWEN